MWAILKAFVDYEQDHNLSDEQKEALYDYNNDNECLSSMETKVREKLEELINQYDPNLGLDYDTDLSDWDDDSSYISIWFDDDVDRDTATKVTLDIRDKLLSLTDKNSFEVYGDQISGGYPSYDPPEYETIEVEIESGLNIDDKITFE